MNFKTYLEELPPADINLKTGAGSRSAPADEKKVFEMITSKCNQALTVYKNDNVKLFRGSQSSNKPFAIIEPSLYFRKSSTTAIRETNYQLHNFLMSILPSWKGWPRRTYSVVFTDSYKTALGYSDIEDDNETIETGGGSVYSVFPTDGAKIAVAKFNDVWNSFPYINKRMHFHVLDFSTKFERLLNLILLAANQIHSYHKLVDFNETIQTINQLDLILKKEPSSLLTQNYSSDVFGPISGVQQDLIKHYQGSIWNYLDELFDPTKNQFRLTALEGLRPILRGSMEPREMWTESPCALVDVYEVPFYIKLQIPNPLNIKRGPQPEDFPPII